MLLWTAQQPDWKKDLRERAAGLRTKYEVLSKLSPEIKIALSKLDALVKEKNPNDKTEAKTKTIQVPQAPPSSA